jgi:hypothetical protein
MSGPKRNPDKLNTIGVVVVGICGAVLVYVSIVALQAFYMDDSAEVQMMADYGGQDTTSKNIRAAQITNLKSPSQPNARAGTMPQTYRIPMKQAMKVVLEDAKKNPSTLVPALGPSDKATVLPIPGRPQPIQQMPPAGGGSADAGQGSAAQQGSADQGSAVPLQPTDGQGMGGRTEPVQTPESGTPPQTKLPEPEKKLPETRRPNPPKGNAP